MSQNPASSSISASGSYLTSPNCGLRLVVQSDGNLVLYNTVFYGVPWNSGTNYGGAGQFYFVLHLKFYVMKCIKMHLFSVFMCRCSLLITKIEEIILNDLDNNGDNTLIMQNDGNLVLYNRKSQAIWSTGTNNKGKAPYTFSVSNNATLSIVDGSGSILWKNQWRQSFSRNKSTN